MILQRYILRELIGSFVFAFCAVLAVCLVGTMFQVFRTFPGLGIEILAKALPLAMGAMATWVMLVASCTSSTLVYARLSAENEITAMRTCGIHAWRIIAPAVLLGILLVGVAYPLNEIVVPWARHNRRMVFRESVYHALKHPPPGNQDYKIGSMRICYTDYKDGRMESPTVSKYKHEPTGDKLIMEWFAPSGVILTEGGPLRVVLTKPILTQYDKGRREELSVGNELTIEFPNEDPDKAPRQLVDQPQDVLWRLYVASDDRGLRSQILLILNSRYAASLTPMLLVLVAMPIGILVRRGSRLAGLGAALPPLLIYFISFFVFQGLGDRHRLPPLVAAYGPDVFLGVLAFLLLWGVSRK
ncbi:MAG: LptF/LptG family permease [Planctomycetes bacterium]|nr:LptF/LptG family permease [Planctomycetota bacterium]